VTPSWQATICNPLSKYFSYFLRREESMFTTRDSRTLASATCAHWSFSQGMEKGGSSGPFARLRLVLQRTRYVPRFRRAIGSWPSFAYNCSANLRQS
jgi:hypothetical protein